MKKKEHKHEPDPSMEDICSNCGFGYTFCKNCDDMEYQTEDGGKSWNASLNSNH